MCILLKTNLIRFNIHNKKKYHYCFEVCHLMTRICNCIYIQLCPNVIQSRVVGGYACVVKLSRGWEEVRENTNTS